MGISNCCVFGKYEGLYFIDYDDIHVFRHKDCDLDGSAEGQVPARSGLRGADGRRLDL